VTTRAGSFGTLVSPNLCEIETVSAGAAASVDELQPATMPMAISKATSVVPNRAPPARNVLRSL
jgi:hypothetical protein